MWGDEVDRVLAAGADEDVSGASMEEIRRWRSECQAVEDRVSFLRRMVQCRLDIVQADVRRRAEGGSPDDLATLLERLPQILADRPVGGPAPLRSSGTTGSGAPSSPAGFSRPPSTFSPPDDAELSAELDALVDVEKLVSLASLADEEVRNLAGDLASLEAEVSRRRRLLFTRIDSLAGELARRYRSGAAIGAPPVV